MSQKERDRQFGRTAVKLRLITPEQLEKCGKLLDRAREEDPDATLADVLVDRAYITQDEAEEILEEMADEEAVDEPVLEPVDEGEEEDEEEEEEEEEEAENVRKAAPSRHGLQMAGAVAGAIALVLIGVTTVFFLMPAPEKGKTPAAIEQPQPGLPIDAPAPAPAMDESVKPPSPSEATPVETPQGTANRRADFLNALASAETFADENPDLFRTAITKLLDAVAMDPTSIEAGRARGKIAEIEKRCEPPALKEFNDRKAKGDESVRARAFGKAVTVFDDFPTELRTNSWEATIEKCVNGYKQAGQRLFDDEAAKAAELIEAKKYKEARAVYEQLKELGLEELASRAQSAIAELNEISLGARDRECEALIRDVKGMMFGRAYREAVHKCDDMLKDPSYELHWDRIQILRNDAATLEGIWGAARAAVPALQGKQLTIAGVTGRVSACTLDEITIEVGKGQTKKKFVDLSPGDILMIAKLGEQKQAALGNLNSGVFLLYGKDLTGAEKLLLQAQKEGKDVSGYLRMLAMLRSEIAAARQQGPTRDKPPNGMVYVPAGEFLMGSNSGQPDERPIRRVFVDAYFIDKHEVTNQDYKKFVDETQREPPSYWKDGKLPDGKGEFPVVMVSWEDAEAYAKWRSKRLPTEAEWEKAARGVDGRTYPWGSAFLPDKCLSAEKVAGQAFKDRNEVVRWLGEWQKIKQNRLLLLTGGPIVRAVAYASGASPYGALHMAGNVREWVADFYAEDCYPAATAANPKGPDKGEMRVIRGGSWQAIATGTAGTVRCSDREGALPFEKLPDCGFRCAMDAPIEEVEYPLEKFENAQGIAMGPVEEIVESAPPVIESPDGMVYVPEGPFLMGADDGAKNEAPARRVHLSAYFIDKCEVTNEDYKKFVDATRHEPPAYWQNGAYPEGKGKHPVTGVTYDDAAAYAKWAGKRLPTEAEWEKAARGTAGRRYPWGDEFDPSRTPCAERVAGKPVTTLKERYEWVQEWTASEDGQKMLAQGGATAPADALEKNVSPFGCCGMAGNAAEWVADWFGEEYYETAPELDPTGPARGELRVVRGGAWDAIADGPIDSLRCTDREARLPSEADPRIGFRCAMAAHHVIPVAQASDDEKGAQESTEEVTWEIKKLTEKVADALGRKKGFFTRETRHFILNSTLAAETTREKGRYCEDLYTRMAKVFGVPKETSVWRGKCVVYLFADQHEYVLFSLDIDNMSRGERTIGYLISENGWLHIAVGMPYVEPPKQSTTGPKKTSDELTKEDAAAREKAKEEFNSALVARVIHAFVSSCKGGSPMKPWVTHGLVQHFEHTELPAARAWASRRKKALDAVENHDKQAAQGKGPKPGEFFNALRNAQQLTDEQMALAWSAVEFMVQKKPKEFIDFFNFLKSGLGDDEAMIRAFGAGKLISEYDKETKKSKPDQEKTKAMIENALAEFEVAWLDGMRKVVEEEKKKQDKTKGKDR